MTIHSVSIADKLRVPVAQPLSSLHERVLQSMRREQLVPAGARVITALSGGADSVALTLLLRELSEQGGFVLAGVAHLNHGLRAAADGDEQFCRELAATLALPIDVERVDVARAARRGRISLEDAGHRERYAFFRRAAARMRADRVATGHHRDDQAETLLMRLIRGAGPDGLAGIRPRAGCVVRPLLHVSGAELRSWLEERGQQFREDETNRDPAFTRNRVRHELIPFLEARFSPPIAGVLARTAEIVRADAEWMDAAVDEVAPAVLTLGERDAALDAAALLRQPPAMARRLARRALEHVAGRRPEFDTVERLLAVVSAPGGEIPEADFPGCRVEWRAARLVIRPPLPRPRR